MELLGKIKLIGDIKTYGDNGFRKRELVLTTEDQYPQHILIEFVQNNCELLDNFNMGQTVRIGISTNKEIISDKKNQTFKFLDILAIYILI